MLDMKRLILLTATLASPIFAACTASITAPGSGTPTISGTSYSFTATVGSCPNAYAAVWSVNGETALVSYSPPWAVVWDTAYVYNNPYNSVTLTIYDALNNVLVTSSAVTFAVNNSNWPVDISVCGISASTSTAPTSTWSGTNITYSVTGTGTNCSNSSASTYVDGQLNGLNHFNSQLYDNGIHSVVMTLYDFNAPAGSLDVAGQWEYQINFQNGSAPMELRSNWRDMWLCTTSQTNCPTTNTFTPVVYNTDESTTAASGITCFSGNTSVATVIASSNTCIVTKAGVGSTQINITDGAGRTALPWVHVNTANTIGSFGNDHQFHSNYVPGVSLWATDSFFSQTGFGEPNFPAYANFGAKYSSIYNIFEVGIWCQPLSGTCGGSSQSAWQTDQTAYISSVQSQALANNLYMIGIGDSAVRQTGDLFTTTRRPPSGTGTGAWSTPAAVTYTATSWMNTRLLGMRMFDEGNTIWGVWPLGGELTLGSTLMPGPINCTTATCTATGNAGALSNGGGGGFIIRGASTHSGLNSTPAAITATVSGGAVTGYTISNPGSGYTVPSTVAAGFSGGGCSSYPTATATVSATGAIASISGTGGGGCSSAPAVFITGSDGTGPPFYFVGSNPTSSSFTFVNPGLGATTVTSSSDPGLVIEPYATIAGWFDANGNNAPTTGPATDYVRYNAFQQFVAQWRASGSNYPLLSWGVAASGIGTTAITNWIGDSNISDYATFYISPGADYLSQYNSLWSFLGPASGSFTAVGYPFRLDYGLLGAHRVNEPIIGEASGINIDYGNAGYTRGVTSCSGNLITFSSPHGIYSPLPAYTRLAITGSSDSNCNQNFYVMDCPNTTACHVALFQASFSTTVGGSITGTFSNGDTFPAGQLDTSNQQFPQLSNFSENSTCTAYHTNNHRGQNVVFTGSGTGPFAGITWWYVPYPLSPNCDGSGTSSGAMFPLPVTSGSGGTATINLSNSYTRGIQNVGSNSEGGPRAVFAGNAYYALLPSAGTTAYASPATSTTLAATN